MIIEAYYEDKFYYFRSNFPIDERGGYTEEIYENNEFIIIKQFLGAYVYELQYLDSYTMKTLFVESVPADIELSISNTTIKMGQNIELKAKILSNESVHGKLIFKINGRTLTYKNGSAIYFRVKNNTVTYNFTYYKALYPDNYTFTTVFGNGKYKRLYDTINFTLEETPIKLILDDVTATDNGQVKVTGKIIDEYGNNVVSREMIKVYINDKAIVTDNYSEITYNVFNGSVDFIFDIPENLL